MTDTRLAAAVRGVVSSAWNLCDDTEGTVHKDEFGEHFRVPKESWLALANALADAEELIPEDDQPACASYAVTLLLREKGGGLKISRWGIERGSTTYTWGYYWAWFRTAVLRQNPDWF